jgi:predicted permease
MRVALQRTLRKLARSPTHSILAIFLVAASTGLMTPLIAIVLSAVAGRSHYPAEDRLVRLVGILDRRCAPDCTVPLDPTEIQSLELAWTGKADALAVAGQHGAVIAVGGATQLSAVAEVDHRVFPLLGITTDHGRGFVAGDFAPSAPPVVVLSRWFWERGAGRDAAIVGKTITIDGKLYEVVGVAPRGLTYPAAAAAWIPTHHNETLRGRRFELLMRMPVRGTTESVSNALATLAPQQGGAAQGYVAVPIVRESADAQGPLWALLAAVGGLVLVAVLNIAVLGLLRGASGGEQDSVELALGARRGRLAQSYLLEACVLVSGGAGLGLWIAFSIDQIAVRLIARYYGTQLAATPPSTLLLVVSSLTAVILAVFAIASCTSLPLLNPSAVLRGARTTAGGSRTLARIREAIVVGEVAGATLLLVLALTLWSAFRHVQTFNVGYNADGLLWGRMNRAMASTVVMLPGESQTELSAFALDLGQLPGVSDAVVWQSRFPRRNVAPFDQQMELDRGVTGLGYQAVPPIHYQVTPTFFRTLGVQLRSGRVFSSVAEREAVINERAATMWWNTTDAVGRTFRFRVDSQVVWYTVVGVAKNTWSIGPEAVFGALGNPEFLPLVFTSLNPQARGGFEFAVRPGKDQRAATRSVYQRISAMSNYRLAGFGSFRDQLASFGPLSSLGMNTYVFALLGMVAVGLALIGVYGTASESSWRRVREMAIRMALGATSLQIVWRILSRSLGLGVVGVVLGVAGAVATLKVLASFVYGVTHLSLFSTLLGVAVVIVGCALATVRPASRTSAVDLMPTLKAE